MRYGLGYAPEDRKREGLAFNLSVKININISSYKAISKLGVISLRKENARAISCAEKTNLKATSVAQKVINLSGGNQQKVVLGKLLCRDLEILEFEEPTVGVDIGARQEIYKIIEQMAKAGKGIIILSSYLPEIIGLSDRIIIMADGAIVGEMNRQEMNEKSEEHILKMASKLSIEEQ
jgi:ribose transport system ATP-binding protein